MLKILYKYIQTNAFNPSKYLYHDLMAVFRILVHVYIFSAHKIFLKNNAGIKMQVWQTDMITYPVQMQVL